MSPLRPSLADITEDHLRALIETGARESLYIEYKRETYGRNDDARKEFLADVSSFANAAGGDLVIGMADGKENKKGVPTEITPINGDADGERLRLESMARDGIEPRISGLHIHIVPIAAGGVVFIVRVPKSYNPPHRVKFRRSNRYHARSSGGKYEPDVQELRNLFLAAPHLQERVRAFRMERIARIAANETPVPLSSSSPRRAVLHIVPYSAFGGFDSDLIRKVGQHLRTFKPFGWQEDREISLESCSLQSNVNFDGCLVYPANREPNKGSATFSYESYCQIFRNGAVETTTAFVDTGGMWEISILGLINARNAATRVVNSVFALTSALSKCDINPPYVVMFSLLGMQGAILGVPGAIQYARQDQYHFIEALLETAPQSTEEAYVPLRPLLDHVASLSGAISMDVT